VSSNSLCTNGNKRSPLSWDWDLSCRTGMRSQRRWQSVIANGSRSLMYVSNYLSAYGATPPDGVVFVPRPCRGRITLGRGTQDRRGFKRIRPLQGRTELGRVFRGRCPRLIYGSPAGIKCALRFWGEQACKIPSRPLGLNFTTESSNSSLNGQHARAN
jgi:hypothetical protein